jgi:hypothetical protein
VPDSSNPKVTPVLDDNDRSIPQAAIDVSPKFHPVNDNHSPRE